MKLFYTVIFILSLASAAFAREESILARVTSYWAGEGSKFASTGRRLRPGHCAVDPKRIPYGSKVVFPDAVCTAVDTGTAVVSRKAARLCGRTASQLKAIVVDRFFDTKREAEAWSNAHSEFMMLRVVPFGSAQNWSRGSRLQGFLRADAAVAKITIIVSATTIGTYDYSQFAALDRYAKGCKLVEMKMINAPIRAVRRGEQAA
jgi:3D (Asp-Asp-Asp) domain-containing protein